MTTETPKLRFPEFSDKWEVKKLGDIMLEGRLGGNYENSESNIGTPIIKMGNLGRGNINLDKVQYLPENEQFNNEDILKEGDLLFNTRNTLELVGKVSIWRSELPFALYNSNIMRMKFNEKIESTNKFMNYQLNTKKTILQLRGYATGTTSVAAIYGKDLKYLKISFPQLHEQTKIANFLTAIDEKIQTLKEKKRLLEEYKKGLMQKIFSQEIRFKQEDGSDFSDWEEKSLGEITFKTDKKNKEKEILPVYSISNKKGFVHQSEQFEGVDSVERGYDTSLYKIVESKTFAYNPARINVGSIGYSDSIERVLVSSLYVCFKTVNIVDDQFFIQFLETKYFNDSVNRSSEGGIRSYLFYENFSQIKITLPSLYEQQKIANFLSSIDAKIEKVGQQIEEAQTFKKGLLQQMFV